ncbi:YxlC family protein [Numidum massiliense]|uniref:YxlC family protein n=1 Tax=Numidum massiliense TaxID=1522315 RepID=UPI0006D580AB|nr:YxlC family protein [Numidum massiliense]
MNEETNRSNGKERKYGTDRHKGMTRADGYEGLVCEGNDTKGFGCTGMDRLTDCEREVTNESLGEQAERQTIDRLQAGLEQLDRVAPVYTPDPEWFREFVAAERQQQRKNLRRDLVSFSLVAIAVCTVFLFVYHRLPIEYILAVQLFAFVVPLAVFVRKERKRAAVRGERVADERHRE